MTAEVVIMNKHGMSLAADSAITSGRDGVPKVYHSANKLFALSQNHPVGIMVYGAASFMEVPWDIIIKSFRDDVGEKKLSDLTDYMDYFLEFLSRNESFKNDEVEEIIIYRTFSDCLKRIVKEVEELIRDAEEEVVSRQVTDWLKVHADKNINLYREQQKIFLELDYASFKDRFGSVIHEVINELITYEIPESLVEKLHILAFEAARKDYFSVGSTGLVMAGYGESEIFPHLLNYRLEGFVFGQLKYKKLKEKKISYTTEKKDGTAAISPFAQREMVDSFIGGIEPNMEDAIFGIIDRILTKYHEQIQKHLNIDFTQEQVTSLKNLGNELYESIEDALKEYQQNNYINPLLGIIRSLPTEELAEITEALVNLTSFKQRLTRATESVGPPIDVAVISKGDGFVWMKRKNYINSEINTGF